MAMTSTSVISPTTSKYIALDVRRYRSEATPQSIVHSLRRSLTSPCEMSSPASSSASPASIFAKETSSQSRGRMWRPAVDLERLDWSVSCRRHSCKKGDRDPTPSHVDRRARPLARRFLASPGRLPSKCDSTVGERGCSVLSDLSERHTPPAGVGLRLHDSIVAKPEALTHRPVGLFERERRNPWAGGRSICATVASRGICRRGGAMRLRQASGADSFGVRFSDVRG